MSRDAHSSRHDAAGEPPADVDPADDEAARVFEEYMVSIEAGLPPDPEGLLGRYPELADRLRAFLYITGWVGRVAGDPAPPLDDYRIIREIACGGMGVVYEAEQRSRGRRVALKVLPHAAALDPRQLARFRNEVRAAQMLRHAHVVPVTSFGCERGVYSYAMQYIEGQNLAELIEGFKTGRGGGRADRDRFARVARWGMQAAEALDHAHEQGVLHRDIKPSNLLVDTRGNLWVTDFGLARVRGEDGLTRTGDRLGTLRYMSPEQALARRVVIDGRTDIYALGVTLYELLALRPAFDGRDDREVLRQIAEEEPPPLRRLDPAIPRHLETIVHKAMAKEREDRYATARELADDLKSCIEGRPIRARPPSLLDRLARWARHHPPVVVSALVILAVAVVSLIIGTVMVAREQSRTARELLIQRLVIHQRSPHSDGWFDRDWDLIREAARSGWDDDGTLQRQAVGILDGLDASPVKRFAEFGALALAFDRDGRRLLMGPATDPDDGAKVLGTRVWDGTSRPPAALADAGEGPVGFEPSGRPVQLQCRRDEGTLMLKALGRGEVIQRFEIPGRIEGQDLPSVAMQPDGSLVAAAARSRDEPGVVLVWDGRTGERLQKLAGRAECLTFSPDGTLVAGGEGNGRVNVWELTSGRVVATLRNSSMPIRCLAFGPDRRRGPRRNWLLAAGDAGGTVTVWDVAESIPRSCCRGARWDVTAVAFSPDGMTLASTGRGATKVWDLETGRLMLDVGVDSFMFGLAFTPDGRHLAVGDRGGFGRLGNVTVWQLEEGRGVRSLRGLLGRVVKVVLSPDGRHVAGLTQDWHVAIWDLARSQLLHVLEVPQGRFADNSGLAFSPDGLRFAFSAGREARLWDLKTGDVMARWNLPPGLQDTLSFRRSGQLSLFRFETEGGEAPPYENDPKEHPRVCRLRHFTEGPLGPPAWEVTEFDRNILEIGATHDGSYFVVKGLSGP
jgi:serine/threonine protein kinase/WD40 repeat protein